ncbi:hypothetical protein [Nafulsella turpanensis]|uniref:hypothetical protein n=1 Tax=Nafulsella turpanensis TaxID=1265690 RepID=UPI00037B5404|nr:hypothetical protein [Nafulsella turpanensis]
MLGISFYTIEYQCAFSEPDVWKPLEVYMWQTAEAALFMDFCDTFHELARRDQGELFYHIDDAKLLMRFCQKKWARHKFRMKERVFPFKDLLTLN